MTITVATAKISMLFKKADLGKRLLQILSQKIYW